MANSIEAIEGIGKKNGDKLRKAGCVTASSLLKAGATRKGRNALEKETGLSGKKIMRCVNMADLFRIKGVSTQYAELLEAAGVDTVKELKTRRADNLAAAMKKVNNRKKLTRICPGEVPVGKWIAQAKKLKAAVRY